MMPAPILTTTELTPIANGDKKTIGASTNSPTTPKHSGLIRANTLPHDFQPQSAAVAAVATDRTRLAPEDAIYYHGSPPHKYGNEGRLGLPNGNGNGNENGNGGEVAHGSGTNTREGSRTRRGRTKDGKERGSKSRGRKAAWKKLLWVKQSYPDNYTDRETFLEHLQRNPRLQPYDFWPLVADSTVIVQQVCAVTIFICCFVAIYQERISPVAVVGSSTTATVLAWVVWDRWVRKEQSNPTRRMPVSDLPLPPSPALSTPAMPLSARVSTTSLVPENGQPRSDTGLGPGPMSRSHSQPGTAPGTPHPGISQTQFNLATLPVGPKHAHSASASSLQSTTSTFDPPPMPPPPRQHSRIPTLKSALLIYFALLGLSPILKSLTRSTSSDSIWALSTWLMTINVFFFDYTDLDVHLRPTFQASLSTNAALMASTVLASRLPSTEHVFSLTLFSIEVFGLFPVFRRHLRWQSWRGHVVLTSMLVMGAGAGVGVVVSGGGWKAAAGGAIGGNLAAAAAMGGCSWWLIGLQRYKNEIHGPWDPARPVIRRWVDG